MEGAGGERVSYQSYKTAGALLLPCLSRPPLPLQTGWWLRSGVAPRVQAEQSSSSDPKLQNPLNKCDLKKKKNIKRVY